MIGQHMFPSPLQDKSLVRLRPDLVWRQRERNRSEGWVVSDPLTLHHYHFGEEERCLLHWLGEGLSYPEIVERFAHHYAPQSLAIHDLSQLVQIALRRGLLGPVDGHHDAFSRYKGATIPSASRIALGRVVSWPWKLLFSKFTIGNPNSLLKAISPFFRCWLTQRAVIIWILFMMIACLLVASHWSMLLEQWPTWNRLTSPQLWIGLGSAFVATRLVHELGHALACTWHGGRCVDMGIMLMMGVVCPYVDVSDSWRFTNRWNRIAVAAAGMYAEWIVASLAALVWCFSYAGPVHTFAFEIMLVCSISTLLFNANPLLRYDGYFILSDLVGIPNLREKADRALQQMAQYAAFGAHEWSRMNSKSWQFLCLIGFGIASLVYRSSIFAAMLLGVIMTCEYWEVSWFGFTVSGMLLLSSLCTPVTHFAKWTISSCYAKQINPFRAALVWSLMIGGATLAILLPFPQRLACSGRVIWDNAKPIFASCNGTLEGVTRPSNRDEKNIIDGSQVSTAIPTRISFSNREMQLTYLATLAKSIDIEQQLHHAKRQSYSDPRWLDQLSTHEATQKMIHDQVYHRQKQLQSLQIELPLSTEFIPSRALDPASIDLNQPRREPSSWMDSGATGRFVAEGTLLGWSVESKRFQIQANIDASHVPMVHEGMKAKVVLEQMPWKTIEGRVVRVSLQNQSNSHPSTLDGTSQTWEQDTSLEPIANADNKAQATYFVLIDLPVSVDLIHGGQATVVIHSLGRSIATIFSDWLARNFRIR